MLKSIDAFLAGQFLRWLGDVGAEVQSGANGQADGAWRMARHLQALPDGRAGSITAVEFPDNSPRQWGQESMGVGMPRSSGFPTASQTIVSAEWRATFGDEGVFGKVEPTRSVTVDGAE